MFMGAYANGTLEAVVSNPLVATAFPENTDSLSQYPARLLAGSLGRSVESSLGPLMTNSSGAGSFSSTLYLVPTVLYGLMFMGQKFPKSVASEKGMSIGEMFKDVGLLGGSRHWLASSPCSLVGCLVGF